MTIDTTVRFRFGRDQQQPLINLLDELKKEGKVIGYTITELPNDEVLFAIEFIDAYSIFLFGYRQADLMKYIFKL